MDELVDVVTSYTQFCVDSVIPSKQITIFPNNKPWVTKDLKGVLNKKKIIFYQGSTEERKLVNKEVKAVIRRAKQTYKNKVESKFTCGNFCDAWQGIKSMAAINTSPDLHTCSRSQIKLQGVNDDALSDKINKICTHFEKFGFS